MSASAFRFCLNFLINEPLPRALEWWRACEAAQIDYFGVADSPLVTRDWYVGAAYGAVNTKSIGIQSAITNPLSRHPSVMASALASLDEIAPGRLICGIGTGGSAVYTIGHKPARVAEMREYILAVKALLRGEEAEFHGRRFKSEWAQWSAPVEVPIYVACAGPKVLRMAAQCADGMVVTMGFSPESLAWVRQNIEEACAEVGRDPDELDLWWQTTVNFGPTVEEAMERNLGTHTRWLTAGSLEGKRIPEHLVAPLLEFNSDMQTLATYHDRDRGKVLVERAKKLGIYEWIVSISAGFWGPPDAIARRLTEFGEQGLTNWQFYVGQVHGDKLAFIDNFARGVLSRLAVPR
jgi:5,10-methylenetetrahydromethanopterin reductase